MLTRLRVLADVIFASSMTVMVMGIEIPDPEIVATDAEIQGFLLAGLRSFVIYTVTFLVVACLEAEASAPNCFPGVDVASRLNIGLTGS